MRSRRPTPARAATGGTWNDGTAACDCDDGYEQSGDGQSCVCATGDEEAAGYRASVLHPNPQSLFDGVRVGLVNTSVGNLTFRRRDIVTRAQGPVAFARVHDSRIAANADFGPGWRLSLAEELFVDGEAATYVDASGARHGFAWTGTAWTASPPTPRHARTTLSFVESNGVRTVVLAGGEEVRSFVPADVDGVRHVLRTVRTPARELVLDYDGGRLSAVAHDGTVLFAVDRDSEGRIAEVRDDHGRSVRYAYDRAGRLETVRDIAGGEWRHAYGDARPPRRAVRPRGPHAPARRLRRRGTRRAGVRATSSSRIRLRRQRDDGHGRRDGRGAPAGAQRRRASRRRSGRRPGCPGGSTLDAANRVAELALPGRTHAYAYDAARAAWRPRRRPTRPTASPRSEHYAYDAAGRLTGATGG